MAGAAPAVVRGNPFENYVRLDAWQMVQVAVMTVTVFPIRLLCIVLLLAFSMLVSVAAVLFSPPADEPRSDIESLACRVACAAVLLAHRVAGVPVVRRGAQAAPKRAPILVVAPHTSFFDTCLAVATPTPSVVAKTEALSIPLLSAWLRLTRFIAVSRDSVGHRRDARQQLMQRAATLRHCTEDSQWRWPQVLIFPEATCHNRQSLLQFYTGAFVPGLPVQPVCVHWAGAQPDCVSYVFDGTDAWVLFWLQLCQLRSTPVVVDFLPVYTPDEAERGDPSLYAENVRRVMARHLGVGLSEYSYADVPYVCQNEKRPRLEHVHKLFHCLPDPYATSHADSDLPSVMRRAHSDDCLSSRDYKLGRAEFERFLGVDTESDAHGTDGRRDNARKLFNAFDVGCRDVMDVREYLIARYGRPPGGDFFRDAFLSLSPGGDARAAIPVADAALIVRLPCCLTVQGARRLCERAARRAPDGGGERLVLCDDLMAALAKAGCRAQFFDSTNGSTCIN